LIAVTHNYNFFAKIKRTYAKSWHRLKNFIVKSKIILYIEVFAAFEVAVADGPDSYVGHYLKR
jgi:hypothetical protein